MEVCISRLELTQISMEYSTRLNSLILDIFVMVQMA